MGKTHGQRSLNDYVEVYRSTYGFESVMVGARQRLLLDLLACEQPQIVVEIGCGSDLLYQAALSAGHEVRRWVIVEASHEFAEMARQGAGSSESLVVIEGYFEEKLETVSDWCNGLADLVICSSVLHEVVEPRHVLTGARKILRPDGGLLHVNVPNARSLHRRLARAMGLISDEFELSERNVQLQQPRIYDLEGLQAAVRASGFRVERSGGYLLKPFTHQQMASLTFATGEVLDGLRRLGEELPEMAAEIYVVAQVDPSRSP